jgi:hypothetical protein
VRSEMDFEMNRRIDQIDQKIKKKIQAIQELPEKVRRETTNRKARTKALIVMGAWVEAQLLGRTDKNLWQYLEREGKMRLIAWALGVEEMEKTLSKTFVAKGDLEKLKKLAELEVQKIRRDRTTLGDYLESRRELVKELLSKGVSKKRVCEILSQDCGFTISVKRLNSFLGEGKGKSKTDKNTAENTAENQSSTSQSENCTENNEKTGAVDK